MKTRASKLRSWILVGSAVSMMGCLSGVESESAALSEDVESGSSALLGSVAIDPSRLIDSFDPNEFSHIITERLKTSYSLTVKTCDVANAQSADSMYVALAETGYGQEISVGKIGLERGKSVTVDLTGQLPVNPNEIRGLAIRKRGRDAWCISRAELRREDELIWRFDERDSRQREQDAPNTAYMGLQQGTGPVWLDDERAHASSSSVLFSDVRIPLPRPLEPGLGLKLPPLFRMRPLELEIHTCSTGTHPQTNDPVHAIVQRDSLTETVILDNVGNDREAGSVDRYVINEHGFNEINSIQIRKSGTDGWCIESVALYAAGEEVIRQDRRVILDNDPKNPQLLPAMNFSVGRRAIHPDSAEDWYYPGLPLRNSPYWSYDHGAVGEDCRACEPGNNVLGTSLSCRPCNSGLACSRGTCVAAGDVNEVCNEQRFDPITGRTPPACNASNLECAQTADGRRCSEHVGKYSGHCRDESDPRGQCDPLPPKPVKGNPKGEQPPPPKPIPLVCDPVDYTCKHEGELIFVPTKGDTTCKYGDPACNRCVHNVRAAWDKFAGSGGKNVSYLVDNEKDDFLKLTGKDGRHFQSFVRVPTGSPDNPWFVASHGAKSGAGHFLVVNGHNGSAVYHTQSKLSSHPGGMQAIGGYVLVTQDGSGPAYIEVLKAHDPRKLHRTAYVQIGKTYPTTENYRAASIGGVKLNDGSYLLVTNYSSSGPYYDFFSTSDLETLKDFKIVHSHHHGIVGSENISLITECGTGDIYAVSTTGVPRITQGEAGKNYWRLFQLGTAGGKPSFDFLEEVAKPRDSQCDARSAATAMAGPDGELLLYCHQRSEFDGPGRERIYYRRYTANAKN